MRSSKAGQTASRKEECRMDRKRPLHPSPLVKTLADAQRRMSHTDVLGSWTGVLWEDADEEPVQDADDL